jgi:hypothetical protein
MIQHRSLTLPCPMEVRHPVSRRKQSAVRSSVEAWGFSPTKLTDDSRPLGLGSYLLRQNSRLQRLTRSVGTTEFRTRRTVSDEVDILEYWVESLDKSTEDMR